MKYRVGSRIIGLFIAVTVATFVVSMPRFVMAANEKFCKTSSNPDYIFDPGEEEEVNDDVSETASASEENSSETEKEAESTTSTPNSTTSASSSAASTSNSTTSNKSTSGSSSSSNKKGPTAEIIEHESSTSNNTNTNSGQITVHENPMDSIVDSGDGAENIGAPEETPEESSTEATEE